MDSSRSAETFRAPEAAGGASALATRGAADDLGRISSAASAAAAAMSIGPTSVAARLISFEEDEERAGVITTWDVWERSSPGGAFVGASARSTLVLSSLRELRASA